MKNVPLGKMRRVKHHVLPQIDSSIPRRSPRVAICAPDLALRDFRNDCGPAERPTHIGNVHSFVSEVVKLKYNRIGLAAIHARVQCEVFPNSPVVFRKSRCGRRLNARQVAFAIAQIPEPLVLGEAALAPRVTNAERGIAEAEFIEWFRNAASSARSQL
jgi:hypothetical protein